MTPVFCPASWLLAFTTSSNSSREPPSCALRIRTYQVATLTDRALNVGPVPMPTGHSPAASAARREAASK